MISNQMIRSEMLERMHNDVARIQGEMSIIATLDSDLDLHDQLRTMGDKIDDLYAVIRRSQGINDYLR